ncbi:MAG: P22 phage major capsid protein family protein [Stackebrandtia sp.]
MTNKFIKPEVIAKTALGLLQREIVLPSLVWRDAVDSWDGTRDDTVSIRVPATTKARRRRMRTEPRTKIIADKLIETKVDVSLTEHVYNAVDTTDEEMTLDIGDFGAKILAPQVRAISEDLEDQIAETMINAPYETELTLNLAQPEDTFVDGRRALNVANVPVSDRFAVLGADVEAAVLKSDGLTRVDASGDNNALREALIGRLRQFPVYLSNAIPANHAYLFHRTAYIFSLRAPIVPDGVAFGQSESFGDLAMTWLRDYDSDFLQDRSIVHTFSGTNFVPDPPQDSTPETPEPKRFYRAVRIVMPESAPPPPPVTPKNAANRRKGSAVSEDAQ